MPGAMRVGDVLISLLFRSAPAVNARPWPVRSCGLRANTRNRQLHRDVHNVRPSTESSPCMPNAIASAVATAELARLPPVSGWARCDVLIAPVGPNCATGAGCRGG
jgi:hypothetical protein